MKSSYKIKPRNVPPYKHVNFSPASRVTRSLPANLNFRLMSVEIKSNFEIKRNVKYSVHKGSRHVFVSGGNQLARSLVPSLTTGVDDGTKLARATGKAGGENIFPTSLAMILCGIRYIIESVRNRGEKHTMKVDRGSRATDVIKLN